MKPAEYIWKEVYPRLRYKYTSYKNPAQLTFVNFSTHFMALVPSKLWSVALDPQKIAALYSDEYFFIGSSFFSQRRLYWKYEVKLSEVKLFL